MNDLIEEGFKIGKICKLLLTRLNFLPRASDSGVGEKRVWTEFDETFSPILYTPIVPPWPEESGLELEELPDEVADEVPDEVADELPDKIPDEVADEVAVGVLPDTVESPEDKETDVPVDEPGEM